MNRKEMRKAIDKRPFAPIVINGKGLDVIIRDPSSIWQAPPPDDDTIVFCLPKFGVVVTTCSSAEAISE